MAGASGCTGRHGATAPSQSIGRLRHRGSGKDQVHADTPALRGGRDPRPALLCQLLALDLWKGRRRETAGFGFFSRLCPPAPDPTLRSPHSALGPRVSPRPGQLRAWVPGHGTSRAVWASVRGPPPGMFRQLGGPSCLQPAGARPAPASTKCLVLPVCFPFPFYFYFFFLFS